MDRPIQIATVTRLAVIPRVAFADRLRWARTVDVRGIMLWRKEPDGRWRVAMEHVG